MEDNYQAEQATTEGTTETTTVDSMADLSAIMASKEAGTEPELPSKEASTDTDTDKGEDENPDANSENENEGESTDSTEGDADVLNSQKANKAFAEMRKTAAAQQKALETLAANMGLSSVDELMKKAEEDALNNKAKAQNLDPKVLARMEELERKALAAEQRELENRVLSGLKRTQDTFGLDDAQVKQFAQDMVENNIDIMSNTVDPVTIYRGLHHDELVEAAVEKAQQEWIKHNNKSENASTPGNSRSQGAGTSDPKKVTSMSQLNDIFRKMNK